LRHEFIETVTRRSFLFVAVGLPLIGALVFFGAGALSRSAPEVLSGGNDAGGTAGEAGGQPAGYVDLAGLIHALPEDIPAETLRSYPDEAAAARALAVGEISSYYVVPADYLASGQLLLVKPDPNPIMGDPQAWRMRWILLVNLLNGDAELAQRVFHPMDLHVTSLAPATDRDPNSPLAFAVPYATLMIFYMVILMASSLLLNSIHGEKKNRVMEILMVSITPRQMLAGKILGLGVAGLLQTVIWTVTGYAVLALGGQTLSLPAGFTLPASILAWGLVFFLLGYLVYASFMAGLGALAPNLREASQATFVIIAPLMVPLFFINQLLGEPNGPLATALSLFPLTAPITMMARLAAGDVPWWQPPLAAALLAITAYLAMRAVAGMFRAQTLLSGQAFSVGRFFAALAGRS
jgi:ABC-2 type transport system permease protein